MLIDEPRVIRDSADPILMLIGDRKEPIRIQQGIYEIGHFGSSAFLRDYEHYPELFDEDAGEDPADRWNYPGSYGVCDSVENLLAKIPLLAESKRQFVITVKTVQRDQTNKGKGGGWRWHKWGQYIGDQTPTTEYLDDEPIIEQIMVYHIYEKVRNGVDHK